MKAGLVSDFLRGVGVLVTRPSRQAGPLCELIRQLGGDAITFPVLEILEPSDTRALEACVAELDSFDWAIFVSANAVEKTLTRILPERNWPEALQIAVVGKRSAEELQRFGLKANICPQQDFNSEALLALPEMQHVHGSRVVIFRGGGGREYLRETLHERGACVRYVESYRRDCPRSDSAELLRRWRAGEIDVVLVNSVESLENLVKMIGKHEQALLLETPLIVASNRIVPVARRLGFMVPPVVAANATDEAVIDALLAWKQQCT